MSANTWRAVREDGSDPSFPLETEARAMQAARNREAEALISGTRARYVVERVWRSRGEVIRELGEALSMLECPNYNGEPGCIGGCHMEPACQVNAPLDGWDAEILRLATELTSTEETHDAT